MQIKYWKIIDKWIDNDWTKDLYITHVTLVTSKALKIAQRLNLDKHQVHFIEEAAMLHDIGIVMVKAEDIGCKGKLDYIQHGVEGRKILENEGLPKHGLVCERHTGVGIDASQIKEQNLPLPERDMIPVTIEEKIISWADLFYSKNPDNLFSERTFDEVYDYIKKYGQDYIDRLNEWKEMFIKFNPAP